MIYVMLMVLGTIIVSPIVYVAISVLNDNRTNRKNAQLRRDRDELRMLRIENSGMRSLLNRIARDDVGNPALESQLKLEEIDNKKYSEER